jgi:hypothetical protein
MQHCHATFLKILFAREVTLTRREVTPFTGNPDERLQLDQLRSLLEVMLLVHHCALSLPHTPHPTPYTPPSSISPPFTLYCVY